MESKTEAPFPQANDLAKVFKILEIRQEETLINDDQLAAFLDGMSSRQARYYRAAARYLGLTDETKHFTGLGEKIRDLSDYEKIIEIIRIILSDPVFGKVYVSEQVLDIKLSTEDIVEIIKEYNPGYTEVIYRRRAQTVKSWILWVSDQMRDMK